jgi:hypothetical protein
MAKYTPDSRSTGTPMMSATTAGAAMPPASATENGISAFIVSNDAVYAPMPMNAAFAIASKPHDSVR